MRERRKEGRKEEKKEEKESASVRLQCLKELQLSECNCRPHKSQSL